MGSRLGRLTDAYLVGIELRDQIRKDIPFCEVLRTLDGPFNKLSDGYSEWHPAPYSFHGMLKLFLYRETTGDSYRTLTRHPKLAAVFGLERIPDESVLSRTWRRSSAVKGIPTLTLAISPWH